MNLVIHLYHDCRPISEFRIDTSATCNIRNTRENKLDFDYCGLCAVYNRRPTKTKHFENWLRPPFEAGIVKQHHTDGAFITSIISSIGNWNAGCDLSNDTHVVRPVLHYNTEQKRSIKKNQNMARCKQRDR